MYLNLSPWRSLYLTRAGASRWHLRLQGARLAGPQQLVGIAVQAALAARHFGRDRNSDSCNKRYFLARKDPFQ